MWNAQWNFGPIDHTNKLDVWYENKYNTHEIYMHCTLHRYLLCHCKHFRTKCMVCSSLNWASIVWHTKFMVVPMHTKRFKKFNLWISGVNMLRHHSICGMVILYFITFTVRLHVSFFYTIFHTFPPVFSFIVVIVFFVFSCNCNSNYRLFYVRVCVEHYFKLCTVQVFVA